MSDKSVVQQIREAIAEERERCARIAKAYTANPLGDEKNDTYDAWSVGMNYTTGGSDTARAIQDAILAGIDLIPIYSTTEDQGPDVLGIRKGEE